MKFEELKNKMIFKESKLQGHDVIALMDKIEDDLVNIRFAIVNNELLSSKDYEEFQRKIKSIKGQVTEVENTCESYFKYLTDKNR